MILDLERVDMMNSPKQGFPTKVIFILALLAVVLGAAITSPPAEIVEPVQTPKVVIGLPVRLQIPSIKVDAAIQYVGLTADGAMGVPSNLSDVAWYQPGTRPGEAGNAVIAGHRSSRAWVAAVFDDLDKLQPGDKITVLDDKGASIAFVVRESRLYDAQANPAEIFAKSDSVHLNLVTCAGKFNVVTQSFPQRLIVFADVLQ
jgi:sortase A